MELTQAQLKQLLPKNPYVEHWHKALSQLLPDYEINTPQRIAAFVAQCAHESGGFMVLKENLNYKAASLRKIFPKYFPDDAIAQRYASMPNKQEAIANRVYANRMGNGPEESGDGYRYCGRGLIQLTGRQNYTWFAASLEITPEEASMIAPSETAGKKSKVPPGVVIANGPFEEPSQNELKIKVGSWVFDIKIEKLCSL